MAKALLVYITAPTRAQASKIAQVLVDKKLAACVSILPKIESRYRWKGRIERSKEILLIIKTDSKRYKALEQCVLKMHSYDVPEIIAVPIIDGNPEYLRWVQEF